MTQASIKTVFAGMSRCALVALPLLALTPALQAATPAQARAQAIAQLSSATNRAGDTLRMHEGPYGMPRYIAGKLSEARPSGRSLEAQARSFLAARSALFPLNLGELALKDTSTDDAGGSHLNFTQKYQGVAVYNGNLVVHLDRDGVVRGVTSNAAGNLKVNVQPTLSALEIYENLTNQFGDDLIDLPNSTLYVLPDRNGGRLVYFQPVTLESVGPRVLFIDAHDGTLVQAENPHRDGMVNGTGLDVSGQVISPLAMMQGRIFKTDVSALFSVYIQNASKGAFNLVDLNTPDQGKIYTFTSNQTYLMDVDYVYNRDSSFDDPKDPNQTSGVTAHDFFRTTLDFYKSTYNRNGIDNAGLPISAVVEVNGIPGYALECNAGWLGYGYNFMMFGMGGSCFDYTFPSFTAGLDVIGHELNHGVNEFTINLGYNHESGALNEHFADVFGLMVEDYAQAPNWLIGDDLFTDPTVPWTCFRSFSDPATTDSIMPQPDSMATYFQAPVSYDAGGVHFNSGIINKAFYLAVTGGTFRGVTVPALATDKTAALHLGGKLWYDVMNSKRISSISQFIDVRDALIASAQALSPASVTSIQKAFDAVGVVNDLYPTASQDATEPNDYPGIAVTIAAGGTATGKLWDRNDTDIYAISLSNNQTVNIKLSGLAYDAQLAVYSVGAYSTLKSEASSNNAGTADENITFKANGNGTFYIEVMPKDNVGSRTAPYTLSVIKG